MYITDGKQRWQMQNICTVHAMTVVSISKRENRNEKYGKVWGPKITLIVPLTFEWCVLCHFKYFATR